MEEQSGSSLFRRKSLDSIASPEQMNDYLRVISPSVWIVLAAVVMLLAGVIIWGVYGRLDTSVETVAFVNGGIAVCYTDKGTAEDIGADTALYIGGEPAEIRSVSTAPVQAGDIYDAVTLEDMGITGYEMVYAITARSSLPDGSYSARLLIEQIHPMAFITGGAD